MSAIAEIESRANARVANHKDAHLRALARLTVSTTEAGWVHPRSFRLAKDMITGSR